MALYGVVGATESAIVETELLVSGGKRDSRLTVAEHDQHQRRDVLRRPVWKVSTIWGRLHKNIQR